MIRPLLVWIRWGRSRLRNNSRPRAAEDRADAPSDVAPESGVEGGVSSTKFVYGDPW